ncbi:MAG: HD domain-containing protein, partial [Planctomycetes bacterium]|nr:HD domain-containing protein [Planctomycetota bacterium]
MKHLRAQLVRLLLNCFGSDDRRIEHALRVLHHAERISDDHPGCDSDIVIASALLHDVGIKVSEEQHGYNDGKTQEKYGPPIAEEMLDYVGFPSGKTEIVKNIIGNHH